MSGPPPALRANHRRQLGPYRPIHHHGVVAWRKLVHQTRQRAPPPRTPTHQCCAPAIISHAVPSRPHDRHHPRRHQEPQRAAHARRQLKGDEHSRFSLPDLNLMLKFPCSFAILVARCRCYPPPRQCPPVAAQYKQPLERFVLPKCSKAKQSRLPPMYMLSAC